MALVEYVLSLTDLIEIQEDVLNDLVGFLRPKAPSEPTLGIGCPF